MFAFGFLDCCFVVDCDTVFICFVFYWYSCCLAYLGCLECVIFISGLVVVCVCVCLC